MIISMNETERMIASVSENSKQLVLVKETYHNSKWKVDQFKEFPVSIYPLLQKLTGQTNESQGEGDVRVASINDVNSLSKDARVLFLC